MLQAFNGNKGIGVIEVLIVAAIITIILTVLLGMISFSLGIQGFVRQNVLAQNLAQEAMEAVRNIKDNDGWVQLANGNHGLMNSSGYWEFSGTENIIGGFTRTILISDVLRDASNNIVESGGAVDPDTKKITVRVSWTEKSGPHSIELITYLTNWRQ